MCAQEHISSQTFNKGVLEALDDAIKDVNIHILPEGRPRTEDIIDEANFDTIDTTL